MNGYESEEILNQYLLFHYGTSEEIAPPPGVPEQAVDFPRRTAELASARISGRALDLGCAVGRSTFELSKHFDEVIGIDFSQSFIDAADALKNGETVFYERLEEASLTTTLSASAPGGSNRDRVTFAQGDAMNLPASLGTFDLVHAANLLCRLREPKKLLERLPSLLNPKGQLVLATPCTWLEEYTPRENWPPGSTLDFLKENLAGAFDLKSVTDLPFLIREHSRKFQLSTSQCSLWTRAAS